MIQEKKQIDRRKFIQSTAILATVPVLAGSPTENLGKTEQKYPTVVEILSSLAPSSLQKKIKPGVGFAMEQNGDFVEWKLHSSEQQFKNRWHFVFGSEKGLQIKSALQLHQKYGVAEHRIQLTNTSTRRSEPITRLLSLFLRFGQSQYPKIMGCSGASSKAYFPHTREFPPDAFKPSWIQPFHYRPVEFASHRKLTGSPYTASSNAPVSRRDEFGHLIMQRGFGERWTGSSEQDLPLFMIIPSHESNSPGLFFGLEWSTFWKNRISFDGSASDLRIELGPLINNLILNPGETLDLPVVHIGFFQDGFERGSNILRRYIHEYITPPYQNKPMVPAVAYTLWPGISVTYTEQELRRQVDTAAKVGVEMFCVDADWYTGGHSKGRGNWEVDLEKFPNGLEPFADYVRSKGMGLGLYFESVAFRTSKLGREHPEYFYQLPSGFFPLKYNFSLPEACDHWIELISSFVERYDLRFIRADFGTDPMRGNESFHWDLVDSDGKTRFAHIRGLYRVWETLTKRHPRLMLELNSGGGNNLDLGGLRRHHCAWLSDSTGYPHSCRMMQLGANTFLPANYLGLAVGPRRSGHGDGLDDGFSDLAFLSRMTGQLLLHGGIASWPPEVVRRAKHWLSVYKKFRHLLVKDYYRLLPLPSTDAEWDAAQFCDQSQNGILFIFRYAGRRNHYPIFLRTLETGKRYRLCDEGTGKETDISGNKLIHDGFSVTLSPNSGKLYSYKIV